MERATLVRTLRFTVMYGSGTMIGNCHDFQIRVRISIWRPAVICGGAVRRAE